MVLRQTMRRLKYHSKTHKDKFKQQKEWQQLVEAQRRWQFEEQRVTCYTCLRSSVSYTYYTYTYCLYYTYTYTYIQFEEQRVGWFQEGEAPSRAPAPGLNDHLLNLT